VAYAGNDHRLGANEAPPSIISVFLGDQLADIYEQIEKGGSASSSRKGGLLGLGSPVLPRLPRDAGDRNRTSPFAFTGNKFEFRALGASQSVSFPATVLNTIVAEALDEIVTELEGATAKGVAIGEALRALLAREVPKFKRILFNGDGYSQEWQEEAARRGLLNLRSTMDALPLLTDEKNVALFERYEVLSHRELESRKEIRLDTYFKTINIEGETTASMGRTMILPAALRYLSELLEVAERGKSVGVESSAATRVLKDVTGLVDEFQSALEVLVARNAELGGDDIHSKAEHMRSNIIPAMESVRSLADRLEKVIPDDLWPLPTYRDMLFVK
jgi:glutamine synthetase